MKGVRGRGRESPPALSPLSRRSTDHRINSNRWRPICSRAPFKERQEQSIARPRASSVSLCGTAMDTGGGFAIGSGRSFETTGSPFRTQGAVRWSFGGGGGGGAPLPPPPQWSPAPLCSSGAGSVGGGLTWRGKVSVGLVTCLPVARCLRGDCPPPSRHRGPSGIYERRGPPPAAGPGDHGDPRGRQGHHRCRRRPPAAGFLGGAPPGVFDIPAFRFR